MRNKEKSVINCFLYISIPGIHFLISNSIFRLSLDLLSEVPNMRLKIALKSLTLKKKQRLGEDLRLKLLRISDLRLGSC